MPFATNNIPSGSLTNRSTKTITITGGAGAGAQGTITVFTVTGAIQVVRLIPVCATTVVGLGPVALGTVGSTSLFLANTVGTAIASTTPLWINTTPSVGLALPAALKDIPISGNVIMTITVADLTAGVINFAMDWLPLSANAAVA